MIPHSDEKLVVAGYEDFASRVQNQNGKGSAKLKLRAARALLGLSQRDFSERFGVSLDTVKSWESSSRPEPVGIARAFIELISDDPRRAIEIISRLGVPGEGDDKRSAVTFELEVP